MKIPTRHYEVEWLETFSNPLDDNWFPLETETFPGETMEFKTRETAWAQAQKVCQGLTCRIILVSRTRLETFDVMEDNEDPDE
jgi:hypothetical protein